MLDYAMLPPEVNSGRMYAGAGAGPMTTAAADWDRLATALSSAATSYRTVVSELADGPWRGPASVSMAAAADRYVEWMSTTAAQAELTAIQAWAAVAAYEAAFAATVPPPVIAVNRATLAALVATNFFGQNTPAIAANQAEYGEMWAQDATAMHSYAANSAAAAGSLTTFTAAPQTTNPTGSGTQTNAAAQAAAATSANTGSSILDWNPFGAIGQSPLLQNPTVEGLNGFLTESGVMLIQASPWNLVSQAAMLTIYPLFTATGKVSMLGPMAEIGAAMGAGLASSVSADVPGATLASTHGPGVSAGVGRAVPLGKLSVPPSWGVPTQEVRLAAAALPTASSPALSPAGMVSPTGMVPPVMGGPVGSVVNTPQKADARVRSGSSFTANSRHPSATDEYEAGQNRWAQDAPAAASGLSEREQDELHRLREEMADLAMDYDAMARLMREAMH